MRVISQKGIGYTLDIPYEQVSVEARGSTIYLNSSTGTNARVIASYSTPEKAEKAMESLWEKYEEIHCWNAYFYSLPSVFRFPEDSEV